MMLHTDDSAWHLDKLGLSASRQHSLITLLLFALRPAFLPPSSAPANALTETRGSFAPLQQSRCRFGNTCMSSGEVNRNDFIHTLQRDSGTEMTVIEVRPKSDLRDVNTFLDKNFFAQELNAWERLSTSFHKASSIPSAVIIAKENGTIVGSLGLSIEALNRVKEMHRRLDDDPSMPTLLEKDAFTFYKNMISDDTNERVSVRVSNVAVRRDQRRRGIGDKLLASAEGMLKKAGYPEVHLQVKAANVPAVALYRSKGYQKDWGKTMGFRKPSLLPSQIEAIEAWSMSKTLLRPSWFPVDWHW